MRTKFAGAKVGKRKVVFRAKFVRTSVRTKIIITIVVRTKAIRTTVV
jgi:hypothetical protein